MRLWGHYSPRLPRQKSPHRAKQRENALRANDALMLLPIDRRRRALEIRTARVTGRRRGATALPLAETSAAVLPGRLADPLLAVRTVPVAALGREDLVRALVREEAGFPAGQEWDPVISTRTIQRWPS